MRILSTAFWLPKKGNAPDEYEDAVFPSESFDSDSIAEFKCAVADGATETSFAGLWAKLLVEGYCGHLDIHQLRQEWNDQVHEKSLAWYAEQKVNSGAFAALVGLTISADSSWKADAIGDSCLMQTRDNKILFSFPILLADDFNNSPFLLSTSLSDATGDTGLPESKKGEWQPGDVFLLMSDALAHWTLKRNEDHGDALTWIDQLTDNESFEAFTDLERSTLDKDGRPLMRNDDVTLLRVKVD
ncbi:MAG TPA: hypothetical protein V6C81_03855 [Planktothrix sp.]|jgi:serine/threonine protein phosphatase PrpC